ncbi:MAG: hypothetical protein HN531_04805 [Opitutae bacterium]|nr:hypothetical protein [Opitutae bacterium]
MKHLVAFLAFAFAGLVGLLSLSSVSSGLHVSLFHGDNECPHSENRLPCGSNDKEDQEEREEELPCPVLLFAHGYLGQDHFLDVSSCEALVCEASFPVASTTWVLHKHDPFGARDPPLYA